MNVKVARNRPERATARSLALLGELVRRDLRSRYVGSIAGPVWSVLSPLLWVLLYSYVFGSILRIPLNGEPAGIEFPEFLLAGFLPWMAIQEGIFRATTCLSDNAVMVKKAVFPKVALVATVVLAAGINELIGLTLYAGYLAWRGHLVLPGLFALVPLLVIQLAATFGIGCLLASVNVFLRDTPQVVGVGLAMFSFVTPIFYSARMIPKQLSWVFAVNPAAQLVEAFRDVLFRGVLPPAWSIGYLCLAALGSSVAGYLVFSRAEPHFSDVL
jgi:lipopolysaccharide transport system permease protein